MIAAGVSPGWPIPVLLILGAFWLYDLIREAR